MLQHEVASLEAELSDPSNPLLHGDSGETVDPGVLMKGLVDVRSRLEKVSKAKDGRGRLVDRVLGTTEGSISQPVLGDKEETREQSDPPSISEMDRRVGDLESLVGSSGTILDEVRGFSLAVKNTTLTRYLVLTTPPSPPPSHHTTKQPTHSTHATTTYRLHIPSTQAPSF